MSYIQREFKRPRPERKINEHMQLSAIPYPINHFGHMLSSSPFPIIPTHGKHYAVSSLSLTSLSIHRFFAPVLPQRKDPRPTLHPLLRKTHSLSRFNARQVTRVRRPHNSSEPYPAILWKVQCVFHHQSNCIRRHERSLECWKNNYGRNFDNQVLR